MRGAGRIRSLDVLAEFESAGKEAVTKGLGEGYRVSVEPISDVSLLYRVVAYVRLGSDSLFSVNPGGIKLDNKMLSTMADLTTRAEEIGSEAADERLVATAKWEPRARPEPGRGWHRTGWRR